MIQGLGVSAGVEIAEALVWQHPIEYSLIARSSESAPLEIERFAAALECVHAKNAALAQSIQRRIGKDEASIFTAHCMMLEDNENVAQPIHELIAANAYSAEYAVLQHFNGLAQGLAILDDEYMRQRADDFFSLRDQLVRELLGLPSPDVSHFDQPTIVVAHALSAADIANMDHSRLKGIICETGGYSSHMAIISRTLGIPAVLGAVGVVHGIKDGMLIALDGDSGEVWVTPPQPEIAALHLRQAQVREKDQSAMRFHGLPTISRDGRRIELSANIGQPAELEAAVSADAESIGLLRTELMHLNRATLPTEEEQFAVYKGLLDGASNKAVTVRTLDAGDDTSRLILPERRAANPAMGFRGIRMSLGRPSLLRPQLRALLRASAYGNLKIMFPMVAHLWEIDEALAALESVKEELRREGAPFDEKMPVGVMIEIPAAAMMADVFASRVNFLTIGVNDLVQFALAADRGSQFPSQINNLYHPAVLRLIHQTVEAAHAKQIPCNLCGEVADVDRSIPLLFGMGVDGLSLNPRSILPARRVISNQSYAGCREAALQALTLPGVCEVSRMLDEWLGGETS